MMDKDVQLLVVGVVGTVAILTVFTKQTDLAQVCVAGLIGFLGAKAGLTSTDNDHSLKTKKEEKINEEAIEEKK